VTLLQRTDRRTIAGVTLLETLAVMMVLALGILGATYLVIQSVHQNRRTLSGAQAQMIAEWRLEQIEAEGCSQVVIYPGNPCHNIKRLDRTVSTVYWSSNGPLYVPPTGPPPAPPASLPGDAVWRPYTVAIDVDGLGTNPLTGLPLFEGGEVGNPDLNTLVNGTTMNLLNIRVTVSWSDPGYPTQAVVLQTRIAP
jgi:type II secretory pathway pseudopilin PulG